MNIIPTTRQLIRLLRRGFEAATGVPRASMMPFMPTPARQISADGPRTAARANYRVANGATASAISSLYGLNVVGTGPSARSQHPNRAMRRALQAAWARFYKKCDVDRSDMCGFLLRVMASLVVAGETLILMATTQRGELRLHLLSPEQLDRSKNIDTQGCGRIDDGVERAADGEIIAYWLFPQMPESLASMLRPSQRFDASDVIHIFDAKWPGQVRGISWLAPVMTLLAQADQLLDALIERMKTGALFSGWITDPSGSAFSDSTRPPDSELSIEPGSVRILPVGAGVEFPNVPAIEGFPELLRHVLRQIGSGVNVPYELIAADLSNTNYSSAKAGFSQFYRRCRAIRASMLEARLLNRLWERVITLEVLSGRLSAPDFARTADDYFAVNWGWDAWESLDPLKDAEADALLIASGIISRQQAVESRGRDFADVNAEIAGDTFQPIATPRAIGAPKTETQNAAA
jgi:lambda family phage portal protein